MHTADCYSSLDVLSIQLPPTCLILGAGAGLLTGQHKIAILREHTAIRVEARWGNMTVSICELSYPRGIALVLIFSFFFFLFSLYSVHTVRNQQEGGPSIFPTVSYRRSVDLGSPSGCLNALLGSPTPVYLIVAGTFRSSSEAIAVINVYECPSFATTTSNHTCKSIAVSRAPKRSKTLFWSIHRLLRSRRFRSSVPNQTKQTQNKKNPGNVPGRTS